MDDVSRERAVRNEEFFRGANQAILREAEPVSELQTIEFLCECSSLECTTRLRLAPLEWRAGHARDRLFVIAPGHEIPEVERVLRREDGYSVVEKLAS